MFCGPSQADLLAQHLRCRTDKCWEHLNQGHYIENGELIVLVLDVLMKGGNCGLAGVSAASTRRIHRSLHGDSLRFPVVRHRGSAIQRAQTVACCQNVVRLRACNVTLPPMATEITYACSD